jgi:CBS domain containing-hemolysin-like protein
MCGSITVKPLCTANIIYVNKNKAVRRVLSIIIIVIIITVIIIIFIQTRYCYVTLAGLKLMILLSQPPGYWDYRHALPCLANYSLYD